MYFWGDIKMRDLIDRCEYLLGYCQLIVTDNQLREIRVNRKGFRQLNNRTDDGVSVKYAALGFSAQNIKWTRMGFWESLAGGQSKVIFIKTS